MILAQCENSRIYKDSMQHGLKTVLGENVKNLKAKHVLVLLD